MTSRRPTKRLKSSEDGFYNNAMLSDITLQIDGGEKIHGHKVFLSNKSRFFCNAFTGRFKAAEEDHMDLTDGETPHAVISMLRHIYELPYNSLPNTLQPTDTLLFYAQVFVIADKYDVPTLLMEVAKDFKELSERKWDSDDFLDAISKLYQYEHMADQSLNDCIKTVCKANLSALLAKPKFITTLETASALTAHLLHDIMGAKAKASVSGNHAIVKCSGCGWYYTTLGQPWGVGTCPKCKCLTHHGGRTSMLYI